MTIPPATRLQFMARGEDLFQVRRLLDHGQIAALLRRSAELPGTLDATTYLDLVEAVLRQPRTVICDDRLPPKHFKVRRPGDTKWIEFVITDGDEMTGVIDYRSFN